MLLQCLALVAILFTPIWIRPTGGSLSERFKQIQRNVGSELAERRPTSITSRVIPIPSSNFLKKLSQETEWSENLESETRQIRFEWALSPQPSEDEWRLLSIERKTHEGSWEGVSLVWNEQGLPIGSVYLELAQGPNLFTAWVVSAKTQQKKKLLLNVAQKR